MRQAFVLGVIASILVTFSRIQAQTDPVWQSGLLNDQLDATLSWSFNDTMISFVLSAMAEGYLAIGISPDGNMLNSYVIIGAAPSSGSWVKEYRTSNNYDAGVEQITKKTLLIDASATYKAGQTTINFTRPIKDDVYPIRIDSTIHMIWALHSTSKDVIRHTSRGSVLVNLSTGHLNQATEPSPSITMHGLMMFLAFDCIVPIGVLVGRFSESDFRVRQHQTLLFLAILVIGGAFALAVVHIEKFDGRHFNAKHRLLGFVVFIMTMVNAVIGRIRPETDHGQKFMVWSWTHFLIGRTLFILGPVTIFAGLLTYHEKFGINMAPYISVHVAVTVIIWMAAIVLQIRKHAKQRLFEHVPDSPRH